MKKVVKIFKHLFIPHEHNDYKPHFFREISITSILIIVVVLLFVSAGSKLYVKRTDMTSAVLPAVLVDLANSDRQANGEKVLVRSPLLDTAARLKAEDMARFQYFAHTSPQGLTPWYWFSKVGYMFVYGGENLAIDFTESIDVEKAWLASPKHRENIMSDNFTEIGIATAEGYYNGYPTTYVVELFGKPTSIQKVEDKLASNPIDTLKSKIAEAKPKEGQMAEIPVVKGEATEETKVETLAETNNYISVVNTEEAKNEVVSEQPTDTKSNEEAPKYSSWKDRLIFLLPSYTDKLYKIFFYIVVVALSLMMIIEVRRQHPKNIMYGILIIIIIFSFIYINKVMFATTLLAIN